MKEFWESQAEKFKENINAVNFDPCQEELELDVLETLFADNEKVCDLGCGNGRTLLHLSKKLKNNSFWGIDFAKGMIDIANSTKISEDIDNINFQQFDASQDIKQLFDFKFDKVLTKRLLINLKGEEKYRAIENIHSILKDNGTYIMVECFMEPLSKINDIRKLLSLPSIEVKFFNEYLNSDFFNAISNKFVIEQKIDFASLYYFMSRIFNARLTEGTPDYYSPMNKLAVELIKNGVNPIQGFSPEIIYILRKK
jgi:ubiquinone/menaquinone biosynthesis C-methylase UbiE